MATLNKVMQMGRVCSDPDEPKVVGGNGSTVTKFRLAVGRSKKNQQTGQWEKDPNTLYIDCEVWAYPDAKRNLVDLVAKYVKKGDPLYIEGRLQLDEWEDKNGGGKRTKHKIVVESIELLGGKNDSGGGEQQQTRAVAPAGNDGSPDGIPW